MAVEHLADGVFLKRLTTVLVPRRPETVFGCRSDPGKPKTVELTGLPGVSVEDADLFAQAMN